ncbi:hypothetical protein X777_09827 [Ooceraea biroi]|uniref:Uncharacterized protein n=1 Tax=Ooceraea biroi TaxID=2015173 RepID=A0A026W649_OOCBI|nr:hypothetical protein X777_09827 [Ooceraea biroi]
MLTARSPAGSPPPTRHGDDRGSQGGPRSVTSSVSAVEVSTRFRCNSPSRRQFPRSRNHENASVVLGWHLSTSTTHGYPRKRRRERNRLVGWTFCEKNRKTSSSPARPRRR